MLKALRMHRFSTYVGFIIWGSSAFTSQPTIASGVVHFVVLPIAIIGGFALAHWEAKD